MRVILIFVDGLGIGKDDPQINPCMLPNIRLLKHSQSDLHSPVPVLFDGILAPLDATMGVDGLPQSATGQTALFTGVNTAKLLGRHLQGYPNKALRECLKSESLFVKMRASGRRSAFINAYRPLFFKMEESVKWRLSASTVLNLSANLPFFTLDDLKDRRSIYHDFTNASLREKGFDTPLFTPEDAAEILLLQSKNYDLLLYEYFMTDQGGHRQDLSGAAEEIRKLDALLRALLEQIDSEEVIVIVTSDHGNIEDLSTKSHTLNPVMTLIWGKHRKRLADRMSSLTDVTPALMTLFRENFVQ